MIVLKFEKTLSSALTAHVDMLRAITYTLRRAGVDAEYSQGFNPHMELGFSAPIALGVQSLCEYVCVKTTDHQNILQRLNAVCPQGIKFTKCFACSVNLTTAFNKATYKVRCGGIGKVVAEIAQPNYCISYVDRGKEVTKDVSARIFAVNPLDDDTALLTLATGNDNLRPDRVVLHLMRKHGLQGDYAVTKVQSWHNDVDSDEFLAQLQVEQSSSNIGNC